MTVERLFQISMAALVVMGVIVLCAEEKNVTLPVVAVIVASSSIYLTDIKGWLRFNTLTANVLGAVALAYVFRDLSGRGLDQQLVTMTYLLALLQFILLYQQKTVRTYWMLMMLSLVQVAVGTSLSIALSFAGLLISYMFVALATLVLFLVHRENLRFAEAARGFAAMPQNGQTPAQNVAARNRRRWPMASSPGSIYSALPVQPFNRSTAWGFARQLAGMGAATLLIASLVFAAVPRSGRNNWRNPRSAPERAVGFTERIQLGKMGEVKEDPEGVVKIRLSHYATNSPYQVIGELLVRGTVLYQYSDGTWNRAPYGPRDMPKELIPDISGLVRQEITLESRTSDIVFCIHPVINAQNDVALQYDYSRNQLSRSEDSSISRITLLTSGLRGGRQLPVTPSASRMRFNTPMLEIWHDRLRDRLIEISDKVVGEIPEENRYERARELERYLRDSGQFLYSLNSQPKDTSVDPIEDFLLNTKRGHCEYFATALALLLRSQDIPARMVVGFKGGEWNSLGEYYRFQQLHAHAWVEAYLRPEQIPAADRKYFDDWDNGGWVRLDPTPGGAVEEVTVLAQVTGVRWSEIVDYAHYLWTSYVLRLDSKSQYDMIYRPLLNLAKSLFQPETWRTFVQRARSWMGISGSDIRDWFNWRAGLAAMFLCLLAVGLFRMAHYLLRRWFPGQRSELAATVRGDAIQVEFYRRFEELLARYDFVRLAGQTQRELAALVAQRIGVIAPAFAVAGPQHVVDAFYRVRFGRQTLDNNEAQAIEQALFELEGALEKSELRG